MLQIKYNEETKYGRTPEGRWRTWHIGEPIPAEAKTRVVTFQADGDELNLFLDAMKASRGEANEICWEKGRSFRLLVLPKKEPEKVYRIWYTPFEKNGYADPSSNSTSPTGIVRRTRQEASRWAQANPAHGGIWSIRGENA